MINIAIKNNSSFPLTPTVLWDHKPAGPSEWIHILQFRSPTVIFEEKALRLAHHFTEQSDSGSYNCHFTGVVNIDADGEGITINVDQFVANEAFPGTHGSSNHLSGGITVPCFLKKNDAKPQSSSSDYGVMIKEVMGKCRGKTRVDPAEMLSARVYASYHDNRTSFMFHMDTDVLLPSLRLRATPVSPVPILATALTRNLCTPMSLSSVQGLPKTGYLSMDAARHLLLVLESDPKAPTLPLIGIWVAGVTSVQHPFVWAAGVRYAMNASLLEKVCRPPEPFLVVLYSPHRSAPEFYECVASNGASQQPVCLLTHHDVFQLSKDTTGRMTTPVEMELTLVESGPRKDLLDAALEQCAALGVNADAARSACDDTVPRSMPAPIKSHIPPMSVKPSVPDVTILFDVHDALSLPSSNHNQQQVNGQRYGNMQQPAVNGSNAYSYDEQLRQQQQQPTGYRLPQHQMTSSTNQQPSYQNGDGNGVYYGSAEQQNAGGIYAAYANPMNGSGNPQQYRGNAAMPQQRIRAPAPGMVTTSGHHVTRGSGVPPQRLAGVHDMQQQQQQFPPQYAGNIAHQQPMMRLEQGGDGRNIRQQQPHAMIAAGQWQQQQQRQQALVSNYNGMMPTQSQPQRFPGEYVANRYSAPPQMRPARPGGPQGQGYSTAPPAHRPGIMKHATGGVAVAQDNYSTNNNVAVPLNVKPTTLSPTAVIHYIPQSESDIVNGTQQVLSPVSEKSGGSQVSSSSNTTSPSAAVNSDAAVAALSPPQVIQLLQHQEEQLRMLREQVALLLSKQDAREEAAVVSATKSADNKENREPGKVDVAVAATDDSISIGNSAKSASTQGVVSSASRHNCSKAVNTSAWLNSIPTPATASSATSQATKKHHSKHRHHRREKAASALDSSSATEYDQGPRERRTKTKARRSSDDVSWTSYATNEVETGQSSTAEDAEVDDTLSLSRSQIEMKVNRNNDDVSVASEIIVDLPAVSLSPEKSGNRSSSGYGGTEDSNRSPELGDSASLYLAHEQDPEMAEQGQGQGAELLYVDQKRYYQNMLSGLQKMLSQQQQAPGSASEAEVNRLRRLATDAEQCLQQESAEAANDSIDVMRRTKERLAGLLSGLDVSVLGNVADDSTLRFEPSILLDPVYLPKVNYTSVYFDRSNDVSMEADAISLKYLTDEQLTAGARQLQRLPHPVSSPVARERHVYQHQQQQQYSVSTARPSADVDKSMYGINPSMSFASRRYLERYGLAAQQQQNSAKTAAAAYYPQQQLPTVDAMSMGEYDFQQQEANDWSRQQQQQIDASAASANLDDVWKMLMEQKQRNSSFERRVPDETFSEPTSVHRTPPDCRSMAASSLNASANGCRLSGQEEPPSKPLFYHSDGDSFHVLAKNTSTPAGRQPAAVQRQFVDCTPPPASSVDRRTRLSEGMIMARQERNEADERFSLNSGRRSLDNSAIAAAAAVGHESASSAKNSLIPAERILDVERLRELPKLL